MPYALCHGPTGHETLSGCTRTTNLDPRRFQIDRLVYHLRIRNFLDLASVFDFHNLLLGDYHRHCTNKPSTGRGL